MANHWLKGKLVFLLYLVNSEAALYLHEPSHYVIQPKYEAILPGNSQDFGFSMAYWSNNGKKLLVGSPHEDEIGQIYGCPIKDIINETPCSKISVDIEILKRSSTNLKVAHQFCLGATIAATPDLFLTCAPLFATQQRAGNKPLVFGTCLTSNENTTWKYKGTLESYFKTHSKTDIDKYIGTTGWSSFFDEESGVILIGKPSATKFGDVTAIDIHNPQKEAISLLDNSEQVDLHTFNNVGAAFAKVEFEIYGKKETLYAFSMQNSQKRGRIRFVKYDKHSHQLIKVGNNLNVDIISEYIGIMYGAALSSSDLNRDGFLDLLVGAPAFYFEGQYEVGAVFLYLGPNINTVSFCKGIIIGNTNGGRFGSAMAKTDIDRDGYAELFISAPYENDGAGAVYILSGKEIDEKMSQGNREISWRINDFKFTQRIEKKGFSSFGYSLQVVPDIDENGCDEIAIGAPDSSKVLLYKGVPSVDIILHTNLIGQLSENSTEFQVNVCIDVEYHPVLNNVDTTIHVKTVAKGDGLKNNENNISFSLYDMKPEYCQTVVVTLDYRETGTYLFETVIETKSLEIDTSKLSKDKFKPNQVIVSSDSKIKETIQIHRLCARPAECLRKSLKLTLYFDDRKFSDNLDFIIGSKRTVSLVVNVLNDGFVSFYRSCVQVYLQGAYIQRSECERTNRKLLCNLPTPLLAAKEHNVTIVLDMEKYTNLDTLQILLSVDLSYECASDVIMSIIRKISLIYDSSKIEVTGKSNDIEITDLQLRNKNVQDINNVHEFMINNTDLIPWIVTASIQINKEEYVKNYKVSTSDEKITASEELKSNTQLFIIRDIKIEPKTTFKILVSTEISVLEIVNHTNKHGPAMIISKLIINAQGFNIEKVLNTTITYEKQLSIRNNKTDMYIIGVVVALVVLALSVLIMFKTGFFRRKSKQNLDVLKENIRKKDRNPCAPVPPTSVESSKSVDNLSVVDQNDDDIILINKT